MSTHFAIRSDVNQVDGDKEHPEEQGREPVEIAIGQPVGHQELCSSQVARHRDCLRRVCVSASSLGVGVLTAIETHVIKSIIPTDRERERLVDEPSRVGCERTGERKLCGHFPGPRPS